LQFTSKICAVLIIFKYEAHQEAQIQYGSHTHDELDNLLLSFKFLEVNAEAQKQIDDIYERDERESD
jgi:sulfopyruvate decarboxylase TPP-binding subunit